MLPVLQKPRLRCHSRSTGNHAKLEGEVGVVVHLSFRAPDHELVADLELSDMAGYISSRVGLQEHADRGEPGCRKHSKSKHREESASTHLDEKVKVALVVVGRGGRVRAHDLLAANLSLDADMLSDGQAEDGFWTGQREAVAGWMVYELVMTPFYMLVKANSQRRVGRYPLDLGEWEMLPFCWVCEHGGFGFCCRV